MKRSTVIVHDIEKIELGVIFKAIGIVGLNDTNFTIIHDDNGLHLGIDNATYEEERHKILILYIENLIKEKKFENEL